MTRNKLKLAYANCDYDNPLTGGDLHNTRLTKKMTEFGMYPYNAWIERLPYGFNIIKNPIIYFSKIWTHADIVIIDCGSTASLTLAKLSRKLRPKIPLIGIIHYLKSERPAETENIAYWKKVEPQLFDLLDAIVCANPFAYRQVLAAGISNKRVHLNTGGYHPELVRRIKKASSHRIHFMFCGYVGRIKGVHILIEALTLLESSLPLHCHIVGDLSKEPTYSKQIIAKVIANELTDKVSFWNDLRGTTLETMFTKCDGMVLPSFYEGYPLSIIEAQCQGLSVISTTAGGIPDAVENRVSGVLVPPGDPYALARAITEVVKDSKFRQNLVAGGYDKVLSLPTWDATCKKFAELILKTHHSKVT